MWSRFKLHIGVVACGLFVLHLGDRLHRHFLNENGIDHPLHYSRNSMLESLVRINEDPRNSSFQLEKLWFDCQALSRHIQTRPLRDAYKDEIYTIFSLIACGFRGGFIRYGDGELALVQGRAIAPDSQAVLVDHFGWDANNQSALGRRILDTLTNPLPSIFYAISCTQCPVSINEEIAPLLQQRPGMLSYSVLFHNTNYLIFLVWLNILSSPHGKRTLTGGRKLILVINEEARGRNLSWADAVYYVPGECVRRYEEAGDDLIAPLLGAARSAQGAVFLVSGGPLAKWLIYSMHVANPKNCYIDVGSAIDVLTKGRSTRPFHTNPGTHICIQH